jgi:hypothetical protein
VITIDKDDNGPKADASAPGRTGCERPGQSETSSGRPDRRSYVQIEALRVWLQTKVIGTEVVYEDPQVAQWGLKNFLSS